MPGLLWSVPALAPLLGAVALAPLFVGVAALASTAWRRAGLAAAGFLWLAVAEVLTGDELLFGAADGTLARARWEGSVVDAASDALWPLVSSPALAPGAWCGWPSRWRCRSSCAAAGRRWTCWPARPGRRAWCWPTACSGDLLAATTELDRARGRRRRAPRWAAWWP